MTTVTQEKFITQWVEDSVKYAIEVQPLPTENFEWSLIIKIKEEIEVEKWEFSSEDDWKTIKVVVVWGNGVGSQSWTIDYNLWRKFQDMFYNRYVQLP